jgi:hypothetical protein
MNPRHAMRLGLMVLPIWAGAISGCDKKDDTVERYQVAEAPTASASKDNSVIPSAAPEAPAPIHWTIPAGWTQLPGSAMRYASFAVSADHPDLQLTVVPLGGAGGSLLSNINRWEGQIGLAPSSEDDLKKLVTRIDVAGTPVDLFDRTGPETADHVPPKRILAAIAAHEDRTWFLKLAGASDLVQGQKANFDSFVQSIRFGGQETTSTPAPEMTGPIMYTAPDGWQQESVTQASAFRVVAFTISSGTDTAEAVVTHVVKDSGTMLDNINRWRGQVDLQPVADVGAVPAEKRTLKAGDATFWDFDNADAGHRMFLCMITHGGQWWFFKLGGSSALVASQKSNFDSFVASIQFRGDAGG